MRVLVGQLEQEAATFNPAPTVYEMFSKSFGDEILEQYAGTKTQLAAAIDLMGARPDDIELVPCYAAESVSGGVIPAVVVDRLLAEMMGEIKSSAAAGPVAGVYLSLHGAMAGESCPDPEGRLLAQVRQLVGADVPIVASLDLHCVLTEEMVAHADLLVPYHTYPHVDQYETGARAVKRLLALLDHEQGGAAACRQIATVRVPLPMLVRGDELITATGRFGDAIRMCEAIEAEFDGSAGWHGGGASVGNAGGTGLVAGVLIGNAFTDVPALQSNVLVQRADGDQAQAAADARKIATLMWENKARFLAELTSLTDSIAQATALLPTTSNDGTKVTVFSDAADATSSGASGDSNAILIGLLEQGFAGKALVPIVDPQAVAAAHAIGLHPAPLPSSSLPSSSSAVEGILVGGRLDPTRFTPYPLPSERTTITALFADPGGFKYENGVVGHAGKAAVLRVTTTAGGTVDVLVVEQSCYFVGQRAFQAFGCTPTDYDVVVIKSPNGFRPHYEAVAAAIVPVDVPGSTSANLQSLPYKQVKRPIFPLDRGPEAMEAMDADVAATLVALAEPALAEAMARL
jgi:microcystin degradation protein MlrC